MRVRFFGKLADPVGREIDVELAQPMTVGRLRKQVANAYPALASISELTVRACIGDALVNDDQVIGPDQTVEFLPTVSGG